MKNSQPWQKRVLWKGIDSHSLEHCHVMHHGAGIKIDSVIVGSQKDMIFRVEYQMDLTIHWEIESVHLQACINGIRNQIDLEKASGLKWRSPQINGGLFNGCTEIDLPLTPFTNSLPINRLDLAIGESQIIRVIYMDLLLKTIRPVEQKYTRLSAYTYKYENVPNDFEAEIMVDVSGLVVNYPGLFHRL